MFMVPRYCLGIQGFRNSGFRDLGFRVNVDNNLDSRIGLSGLRI